MSRLTPDGHQHAPLATSLRDMLRFATPPGPQILTAANSLTPLPLLTTALLHTVHHLLANMATRLPGILQLGRQPILEHNLFQQV